jgi:transcription antitermination factor NusB
VGAAVSAAERRAARERALGLLYEAETKGCAGSEVIAQLPVAPDPYTAALVAAVDAERPRIDDWIERFARGWSLARMPALDRAAVRMGAAELLTQADVPTGVVLAETVDLASRFSTDGSGRFVNGLLARIAREIRGGAGPGEGDAASDAPARSVDGLVIDLDGVIRHWDPIEGTEERLGLPPGALARAAFDPERLERAMDGSLPFEAWTEEIAQEVAAAHGADPEAVAEAWASTTWRIDLEVLDLVRALREAGVPVALLSNASTRLFDDLERSGIEGEFDAVVSSAEIGVTKPDARAFEAAAGRLGLSPERCLFVDDLDPNVTGARSCGMAAAVFTGADELRTLLRDVGLLA